MRHYDPWAHTRALIARRVVEYVLLSIGLGLTLWALLLHWLLGANAAQIMKLTMTVGNPQNLLLAALLCQSLAIGALVVGAVFAWLLLRSRLRGGERHLRGAQVQDDSP